MSQKILTIFPLKFVTVSFNRIPLVSGDTGGERMAELVAVLADHPDPASDPTRTPLRCPWVTAGQLRFGEEVIRYPSEV